MTLDPRSDPVPIDRREAAERLRIAHITHDVDEAHWAYSALPHSRPALRLLIECLIASGHDDDADALIARGLLLRPTDPSLALLRARSLLNRRRFEDANREVRRALRRRPGHSPTIETAARIERARGNFRQALVLLRYGRGEHPKHQELRRLLAITLLDVGRTEEARAIACRLPANPLLEARLATAEGRHLDAIEILEHAGESPDVVCLLLQRLAKTGRYRRLRGHLERRHHTPDAAIRLECARSWIALGEFGTAASIAMPLRNAPRLGNPALEIVATAAALADRPDLARRALARRTRRAGEDRRRLASLWCRGIGSRLISRQMRPRGAGSDRNQQILPTLIADAERILAESPKPGLPGLPAPAPAAIRDLRDCLAQNRESARAA